MRNKDAIMVATVLGNELRTCSWSEADGLLTALGAIAGHMAHLYGPSFDLCGYHHAAQEAAGALVTWDGLVPAYDKFIKGGITT